MRRARSVGIGIVAALLSGWLPTSVFGQSTAMFDHMHVNVPDPVKAAEWYVAHLSGEPGPRPGRVYYGGLKGIMVAFLEVKDARPSAGTVTDHFALSVANLGEVMQKLQGSGAKILEPASRKAQQVPRAVIEDPWGTKIELLEDPAVHGFHHLHLRVVDVGDAARWFSTMLGGEVGKWQGNDGVRFGPTWVLLERAEAGTIIPLKSRTGNALLHESNSGHAIDHAGFRVDNMERTLEEFRAKGVPIISQPMTQTEFTRGVFDVQGPGGVQFELLVRK